MDSYFITFLAILENYANVHIAVNLRIVSVFVYFSNLFYIYCRFHAFNTHFVPPKNVAVAINHHRIYLSINCKTKQKSHLQCFALRPH